MGFEGIRKVLQGPEKFGRVWEGQKGSIRVHEMSARFWELPGRVQEGLEDQPPIKEEGNKEENQKECME